MAKTKYRIILEDTRWWLAYEVDDNGLQYINGTLSNISAKDCEEKLRAILDSKVKTEVVKELEI